MEFRKCIEFASNRRRRRDDVVRTGGARERARQHHDGDAQTCTLLLYLSTLTTQESSIPEIQRRKIHGGAAEPATASGTTSAMREMAWLEPLPAQDKSAPPHGGNVPTLTPSKMREATGKRAAHGRTSTSQV